MTYSCPKSHGHAFVRVAKTYRYEPRTFLWLAWVAEIHDGFIVRCTDHGCARYWRVGLDGVHVPAGHEVASPTLVPDGKPPREPREPDGEPPPPLGLAVRRPSL